MTSPPELPERCGIAFKEWAGVCDALGEGRQSLILRKGGIAEGPSGFVPEHRAFWLYPTHVHEAQQGLRIDRAPAPAAPEPPERVPIRWLAVVEAIHHVDRLDRLPALEEFHVWTEETVRKRFEYRRPGLWALCVRVLSRPDAVELAVTAEQTGCKTWVPIEPPLGTAGLSPVLDDAEFARRGGRLHAALGSEP